MHSAGRLSSHKSGALPITRGISRHVVFVASRGTCRNAVHLEPYTWVGATVILLNGWLEVLGVFDYPEMSCECWKIVDRSQACRWSVSYWDDIEVVGRAVVLVVLGTPQEFMVVHDPEICSLNGVVGVKGVGNPVLTVVVSTSSYLHFISYAVTLASFCTIGLDQRMLSSCIVSWVWSGVPLDVGSIGCVVDSVTSSIGRSVF
jgi:hypothetical protein